MTDRDPVALAVIGAGAAFGLLGAYSSFEAVRSAMEPSFGPDAWIVPVGVDLGIATASAGDLWMASRDERTWWLRWIPHGLAVGTIYFNVAAGPDLKGRVAHALLVVLWIAFTAAVAHVVKLRAIGRRAKTERMDRIRGSRWALAPLRTLMLWRRMVLWETRSYASALALEQDALLARVRFRKAHGWLWRFRADPEQVVLWKLRRMAPTERTNGTSPQTAVPVLVSVNGSVDPVETIARRLHETGDLTRRELIKQARAEGHGCGTEKAGETIRKVQGDQ